MSAPYALHLACTPAGHATCRAYAGARLATVEEIDWAQVTCVNCKSTARFSLVKKLHTTSARYLAQVAAHGENDEQTVQAKKDYSEAWAKADAFNKKLMPGFGK